MKTLKYYLLIIITVMIWGGSWPISKTLVTDMHPIQVSFMRNLLASIAFFVVLVSRKDQYDFSKLGKYYKEIIIMGLLGLAAYSLLFLFGLSYTTSAQGSIIVGIGPTFVAVLALLINRERLEDTRNYFGIIISFLGVLFVIGFSVFIKYNPENTFGNMLIVVGVIFWALNSVLAKRVYREVEPIVVLTIVSIIGTIAIGIAGLIIHIPIVYHLGYTHIGGFIWLGLLSSFGGTFLYGTAIKGLGSTKSSIFVNMVPIFGLISTYLLLGEQMQNSFYIGLSLILVGIFVMNYKFNQVTTTLGDYLPTVMYNQKRNEMLVISEN